MRSESVVREVAAVCGRAVEAAVQAVTSLTSMVGLFTAAVPRER
jgi:hypothetical protein